MCHILLSGEKSILWRHYSKDKYSMVSPGFGWFRRCYVILVYQRSISFFLPLTYPLTLCFVSSCLVYVFVLLFVSKQNEDVWMVGGRFSVLHFSLASESSSQEPWEAVTTQERGRNGKDVLVSCRLSREVLRSQELWVSWVSGFSCLSPWAKDTGRLQQKVVLWERKILLEQ